MNYSTLTNPAISELSPETVACARASIEGPTPLVESVCQSTTYVQNELSGDITCTYSRVDNPTVAALETTLRANSLLKAIGSPSNCWRASRQLLCGP